MGPEGAVNVVFRKQIAAAANPVKEKRECVENYRKVFANPYKAAKLGDIDEVIVPRETRRKILLALEILKAKLEKTLPKKHGTIPL
jgi:acetyl-CoA carboxylase carboxyltransferase component